jgi:hypothetical protein
MYTTCLFCNRHLGTNEAIPDFPVGRRLAFDLEKGRLWVVCRHCGRWNLTPLEERWEAMEECERRFHRTPLRVASDNVGMAQLREGLQLVRIGKAMRTELAAWRYGRYALRLPWRRSRLASQLQDGIVRVAKGADAFVRSLPRLQLRYDLMTWIRLRATPDAVVTVIYDAEGGPIPVRLRHLESAELLRPEPGEPWTIRVRHDGGVGVLSGDSGVRTAGKLLAAINGFSGSPDEVDYAITKLEDAGDPEGFFSRVAGLAMRTAWGRHPSEELALLPLPAMVTGPDMTEAERLAFYVTTRSFWGRGGIGSEPLTFLPRLPLVDRLALEMAANEDVERRAMAGELAELEAAWREAEEIAAIADGLLPTTAADPAAADAAPVPLFWRPLAAS